MPCRAFSVGKTGLTGGVTITELLLLLSNARHRRALKHPTALSITVQGEKRMLVQCLYICATLAAALA